MQIKATLRFHFTPVGIAISEVLVRMWEQGNPNPLLVGMQAGATTMEKSWRYLKN
jgi:hypothetical protein